MAGKHAIELLFEDVVAQLAADRGVTVPEIEVWVNFGQREIAKRINYSPGQLTRVVFAPGDDKGEIGEYGPALEPRKTSFNPATITPRTLYTLNEIFRVYCWAFDSSAAENELKQYCAARLLHDQVVRAIHRSPRAGVGNFVLTKPKLVPNGPERKFGCELVITLVLIAKIPDDPGTVDGDFTTVKPTTGIGPTKLPDDPEEDTTAGA